MSPATPQQFVAPRISSVSCHIPVRLVLSTVLASAVTVVDPGVRSLASAPTVLPPFTPIVAPRQLATSASIHDIQGASHISPLSGTLVLAVPGVVVATRPSSFYLQDPNPDGDARTSEGIVVFTDVAPGVAVGDSVLVTGTVQEYRPGGSAGRDNLTITQIAGAVTTTVLSSGNPLPPPTFIGTGGRLPPTGVIENDAGPAGDVEATGVLFDPEADALDFYESVEGMRVVVNNAVAVGPTSAFGELPVIPDNGNLSDLRTARGGVVVRPGDVNLERLILDDGIIGGAAMPDVAVGATVSGPITAVVDYSFGNFKFLATEPFVMVASPLTREVAAETVAGELVLATLNAENLALTDAQAKFDDLAAVVVDLLRSPDLIALAEVQDNNGAVNDAVVDASLTWTRLITSIAAAGGPTYAFRDIAPVDGQDGGEPGGNIRVGFLFRSDRELAFVDRAGGSATTPVSVTLGATGPQLTASPGRIDPINAAFSVSRKPLAGEFVYDDKPLFVIATHFTAKSSDDPLFGRNQPPGEPSEAKRVLQATVVADFVAQIRALQRDAFVVVLGDFNAFQFSSTLATLTTQGLVNLTDQLPENERYTYLYDGNAQALDHVLISSGLQARAVVRHDIVHVNAEFPPAQRSSDHDPQLIGLQIAAGPTECPARSVAYCNKLGGVVKDLARASSRYELIRTGAPAATVSIEFHDISGAIYVLGPLVVPAADGIRVALRSEALIPDGFSGYALVYSDQPLTVLVVWPEYPPPPPQRVYLPLVARASATPVPTTTPQPTVTPILPTVGPPSATPQPTATRFVPPPPAPGVKPWCENSTGTRRVGAICNDGTTSTATGSGACSRHGGVRCWIGAP